MANVDNNVIGNPKVIEALQTALQAAQEHQLNHVAISLVGYPNKALNISMGDIVLERNQVESVGYLHERLKESVSCWAAPKQDKKLGFDYACFNLAAGPLGYDFITWLVDAEMRRVRMGAPAPLKVGWWEGPPGTKPPGDIKERRDHWREMLYRPALSLIGAVEDPKAEFAYQSEAYTKRHIIAAAKKGEKVPMLATELSGLEASYGPITITLREAEHWPHRNSDISVWHRFAMDLHRAGERVVFVRDTAKAYEPIAGFETSPQASIYLLDRAALYQDAKANFFIANGPVELAVYGERPWLQFIPIEDEESGYKPNRPSFWLEEHGLEVGSQLPWSLPTQRMVWQAPTYHNLHEAWEALKPLLEEK